MAGGFPVGYSWAGATTGSTPSSSNGISITASATANTKGSYSQLIASTTADCSALLVTLDRTTNSNVAGLLDIAVGGAGAEKVIAPNLHWHSSSVNPQMIAHQFLIPCSIPAGSRISARCQSSGVSTIIVTSVICISDMMASYAPAGFLDDIGTLTATSLLASVDPGATANTKGSYTQLIASTTRDYRGFLLCVGHATTTPSNLGGVYMFATVDLAVGGAGTENIIIADYQISSAVPTTSLSAWNPTSAPFFPISIPAGSRIAARAQCSTNTATGRLIGVAIYGVP